MSIYKYQIDNPITDTKKPFLDKKGFFIVPNIIKNYKYFIQCYRYNPNINDIEYFILLNNIKFDKQCRRCNVDNYGRLKINLGGNIKQYVEQQIKYNGNVNFKYIKNEDGYDVFMIE